MFIGSQNEYGISAGASRSFWIATITIAVSGGIIASIGTFGFIVLAIPLALAVALLLLRFPEVTLACLMMIGSFKGARQLPELPIDLTVLLLLMLIPAVAIGLWKKSILPLPWEFSFYVPIVFMMLLSLTYTPHFEPGLEKTARFLVISGLCIISPFVILTSPTKINRFFLTLLAAGLVASATSFGSLGGYDRLTTPSGDTIQLGHDAVLGLLIIWFGLLPGKNIIVRTFLYSLMGLLAIAMVGSGSRGPFLGFILGVLLSLYLRKKVGFSSGQLFFDSLVFGSLGLLVLLSVGIPKASFNYLAQLRNVQSADALMGGRAELARIGWRLTTEHPLGGVGIDGFPTRVAGESGWPHNTLLEISSELGLATALSFCCLIIAALRRTCAEFWHANEELRPAANMILAFLVIELINMMNTGNINDIRPLWTCISLPFVLRQLRLAGWYS